MSYKHDPNDEELKHLIDYINLISTVDDMRVCNDKSFKLNNISKSKIDVFIDYYNISSDEEEIDSPVSAISHKRKALDIQKL